MYVSGICGGLQIVNFGQNRRDQQQVQVKHWVLYKNGIYVFSP